MNDFGVVVFDFDGTLFDTRSAIIHCIQRTFAELGRPLPDVATVAHTIKTGITLQATLGALDAVLRGRESQIHDLVKIYRDIYAVEADLFQRPYPGVGTVLRKLQAVGTKSLIISNKGIAALNRSLERSGLRPYIDMVFGDEPDLPKKPDPAIPTEYVLPRYAGFSKHQIMVVGDTVTDILFARSAGLASCWASYGYGDVERCRSCGPDYEVSEISNLPGLVRPDARW
jgi:phosphoglycolate phosphatase